MNFHWGEQGLQPCWRFLAQGLIACSRVSSLYYVNSGGSPPGITSPNFTSRLLIQRS